MARDSLTTAEAVVLDGANGVTQAPRAHLGFSGVVLLLGAALALRVLFSRGPRWLWPVVLGVAAVPGLVEVLVVRADAPVKRISMAKVVRSTLAEMQALAPWPAAVAGQEEDDVLFPLARYAIPGRRPSPPTGVVLDVRGGRLGAGCQVLAGHVQCGAPP